jgi:hypothetical protein
MASGVGSREMRDAARPAVVLFVALAGVSACGSDDDPEGTVRSLYDAALSGDAETACALVTERAYPLLDTPDVDTPATREECVRAVQQGSAAAQEVELVDARTVSEEDTSASVEAVIREAGEEQTLTFDLVREGDKWMVDGPLGGED